MKILIKNGRIIDPDSKMDQVAELLIEDDKIAQVEKAGGESRSNHRCKRLFCYARID